MGAGATEEKLKRSQPQNRPHRGIELVEGTL
jgi:hypothetical protein